MVDAKSVYLISKLIRSFVDVTRVVAQPGIEVVRFHVFGVVYELKEREIVR